MISWGNPVVMCLTCVLSAFVVITISLYSALENVDSTVKEASMYHRLGSSSKIGGKMSIHQFREYLQRQKDVRKTSNISTMREKFEATHPRKDFERTQAFVKTLRVSEPSTQTDLAYDIHDCPTIPADDYPAAWNVIDVLHAWNPDDTEIPDSIHQGLCIFQWEEDGMKIQNYREREVPFLIQGYPETMRTAERWMSSPDYLIDLVGEEPQRNEYSKNNHFMFWRTKYPPANWTPPTENIKSTYQEWLTRANRLQNFQGEQSTQEHWYFRLNGLYQTNDYLYDELPYFNPTLPSPLMTEPKENRGINCRFGMKGVIAEMHYDSSRNFIVLLGGQRRYVLAHPNQCDNMELYPPRHPSGRHSQVNWSRPGLYRHTNRPFASGLVNEVVLQAGDVMYLPTGWFHFIVSLNVNYQCNARSGMTETYKKHFHSCGFRLQ